MFYYKTYLNIATTITIIRLNKISFTQKYFKSHLKISKAESRSNVGNKNRYKFPIREREQEICFSMKSDKQNAQSKKEEQE